MIISILLVISSIGCFLLALAIMLARLITWPVLLGLLGLDVILHRFARSLKRNRVAETPFDMTDEQLARVWREESRRARRDMRNGRTS